MLNRFLIDRSCRVIAISQYLTDHFSRKKIPCVNIPVVVSDEDLVAEKHLTAKVNFVYAGQAGKKDYLYVVLAAMMLLTEKERTRFTFHIVGCSREQLSVGTSIRLPPSQRIQLVPKTVTRVVRSVMFAIPSLNGVPPSP